MRDFHSSAAALENPLQPTITRSMPSGRLLVVKTSENHEELTILSPDHELEVAIVFTEHGPLVRVHGGRLEIDSADEIAMRCRRFELEAAESASVMTAGKIDFTAREMTVNTQDDIRLEGRNILLNCGDLEQNDAAD